MVNTMTTRTQRADALERWADDVDADDLVEANTAALRTIAELVEQRDDVDTALLDAIRDARNADRSWSEIGAMLGVSEQAAQRKYAAKISAQSVGAWPKCRLVTPTNQAVATSLDPAISSTGSPSSISGCTRRSSTAYPATVTSVTAPITTIALRNPIASASRPKGAAAIPNPAKLSIISDWTRPWWVLPVMLSAIEFDNDW
jgi:hypothetical protein